MKIELCVNAVDVPANITTDTTNPNHLDTTFLPSLSPPSPKGIGFSDITEVVTCRNEIEAQHVKETGEAKEVRILRPASL
jgi:hypothetical protein